MIESATGATFAAQKQESPDAKVSCLSKEYMYAVMQISLWRYKSEFWQKILTINVKVVTIKINKVKCYEQEKSSGGLTESCGLL